MPIGKRYPPELRERAVRMVYECRETRETDYGGSAQVLDRVVPTLGQEVTVGAATSTTP